MALRYPIVRTAGCHTRPATFTRPGTGCTSSPLVNHREDRQRPSQKLLAGCRLRASTRLRATSQDASAQPVKLLFGITVSSQVFLAMEFVVLLVQLALVDAAFSGDWSRIGVITPALEQVLQKVVYLIVAAHSVTGAVAANMASSRGLSPLIIGLKGFLFGSMEVWRVGQLPPKTDSSN